MSDFNPFPIKTALFILLFACLEIALISKNKHKLAIIFVGCFCIAFPYMLPKPIDTDSTVRLTIAQQEELAKEHERFSTWYTDYYKKIDRLDVIWQKYHRTVKLVQDNDIQIINSSIRMDQLFAESQDLNEEIAKLKIPPDLSPTVHEQVQQIITKTQDYSKLNNSIIEKSTHILDSKNSRNKDRTNIVKELQSVIILNSQVSLDIMTNIATIKEYFSSHKI